MFHDIPVAIRQRMLELEQIDAAQRSDNSLRKEQRLLAISPECGQLLALLASLAPQTGLIVEVGTSSAYSTLWLALACRGSSRRIRTFEKLPGKLALAKETIRKAGLEDRVELTPGDAMQTLDQAHDISFCFLDGDKQQYLPCYEKVVPRMIPGAVLVADNVVSHAAEVAPFLDRVRSDLRVDALRPLSVGKGMLVCRKI